MEKKTYDIIIIGSGPGGYTTAVRASQLGKTVACIERDRLGGVCLNWGCIPTKALIKSAEVYHNIKDSKEFGIDISNFSINFGDIIKRSRIVSEKQEKGVEYLFKKYKVDTIFGEAKFKEKNIVTVYDNNNITHELKAENIIIATGARPKSLYNVQIDNDRIISSTQAMILEELPKNLIIIGAGAIGVEFGYIYNTLGTNVTIIEALPHLLPNEDEEISKTLEREFRKQKIKYHTKSYLENIEKKSEEVIVSFKNKKGEIEKINGDYALMAIGVQPNSENLNLEELGIETDDKGFIKADKKTYKTNIGNIFAIGDVIQTPLLAHVASHEGISCIEQIVGLESPTQVNYNAIPACTYCNPQVASIGYTEQKAKDKGYDIIVGKFSFKASGKASAIGYDAGLIKFIIDKKTDYVLGCHMIGPDVTELVAEVGLAITSKISSRDIIHTIHAHPTLSEGIMEASGNAYGVSINV